MMDLILFLEAWKTRGSNVVQSMGQIGVAYVPFF